MKFKYIDIFAKIYDKTDFVIVNYEMADLNVVKCTTTKVYTLYGLIKSVNSTLFFFFSRLLSFQAWEKSL